MEHYACGNNNKPDDHPRVRWTEKDVEDAIIKDLDSIRLPDPEIDDWFRGSLKAAFADIEDLHRRHTQMLAKRKTELAGMQDRLLNAFLGGTIDEATFNAKTAEMRREAEDVERSLDEAGRLDPAAGRTLLET